MSIIEVFRSTSSGVAKISLLRNGETVATGSGFLVAGGLITNSHVLRATSADTFGLRFADMQEAGSIRLSSETFLEAVVFESPQNEWDVAFLALSEPEFSGRHVFELQATAPAEVGQQVGFIGYPFELPTITCHVGYISSIFQANGITKIQLDASVNGGNSGGPLLELENGRVIGTVTRAHVGFLADQFDQLIQTLQQNVQILSNTQAVMSIGGVDPIQGVRSSQAAMIEIAKNLRRSANVGIGYAFATSHLHEELTRRGLS